MANYEEELQIIEKLRQDIVELNGVRSGLQNEIAAAREAYKKELDTEYAGMKAALQAKYDQLLAEEKDKIAQIDEKLKEASVIHAQNKEVLGVTNQKLDEVARTEQLIHDKYAAADAEISSIKARLDEKEKVFDRAIAENVDLKAFLISKKQELDNREFQLEQDKQELNKIKDGNISLLSQANSALDKVTEQREGLKKESEEALAIYSKIRAEKEELEKLQSLKEDIARLEALQKTVDEKQAKLDFADKDLARRIEAIREKEQTLSERERLINLRDKEVSGKIDTLNKLREAGKNA